MYSAPFRPAPFRPDPSVMQHAGEREAYTKLLRERESLPEALPLPRPEEIKESSQGLSHLLELISPEDSALVALIVFLLCDNTDNDVVLLGILLYVLLSK